LSAQVQHGGHGAATGFLAGRVRLAAIAESAYRRPGDADTLDQPCHDQPAAVDGEWH
jgi:hypothetical protein